MVEVLNFEKVIAEQKVLAKGFSDVFQYCLWRACKYAPLATRQGPSAGMMQQVDISRTGSPPAGSVKGADLLSGM
jgi:hypothetical protein